MIRLAAMEDLAAITAIYEAVHTQEEMGNTTTGWIRGVYPTGETVRQAFAAGDLYVLEENGVICAAARVNTEQVPEYANAAWTEDAPADRVLVLHTLAVHPDHGRSGLAKQMVAFYEQEAIRRNRPYLRMDTNARNLRARKLYASLGYREADIVGCEFNGIPDVKLVCLEKTIKDPSTNRQE